MNAICKKPRYSSIAKIDVSRQIMACLRDAKTVVLIVRHLGENSSGRRIVSLSNMNKRCNSEDIVTMPLGMPPSESTRALKMGAVIEFKYGNEKAHFVIYNVNDTISRRSPMLESLKKAN